MINLPILTVTALANGINPCGIGMMITFLGYLLVFGNMGGEKTKRAATGGRPYMGKLYWDGGLYILSVFVTYLVLGLMFYQAAFYMQRWWLAGVFKQILGGLIVIAGLIQLKDVFWQDSPFHLRMPKMGFEKISKLMAKTGAGVTVLIGVLTTIFATPCMLPLYVGTTAVIARSGLSMTAVLGYFLYYNLIFVMPLIVILMVMIGGKRVVEMKEWEHKNTVWMRFVLGMALVVMGIIIVFR
jgi:cytochrome c biogenesis protein CcdA